MILRFENLAERSGYQQTTADQSHIATGSASASGRRLAGNSAIAFAGLSELAEPLLQLVNELAREASFPEAEFERERRQLVEGLRIERTTPGFLASERLRKVLFGAHPYGTVSPTEAQVESYRLEQLTDFYRQYYRPGNALLVLVGAVARFGRR